MAARSVLGKALEARYKAAPVALQDVLLEIQRQAGSGRKAAALIGIGETTWRRWLKGQTARPKNANLRKAQTALRTVRTQTRPMTLDNFTLQTKDRDGRERTITARQMGFTETHITSIERAFIAAGADAAARTLVSELNHTAPGIDFYHGYLKPSAAAGDDDDLDGFDFETLGDVFDDDLDSDYAAVATAVKW